MKISPYINIERIEFIVTYHCTGRCLHCSVGDSLGSCPDGHHAVRAEESIEAVRWLAQHFPVTSLMTFGGEPLLYPDAVCDIHRTARDCGIGRRQIITNGFFSRDEARIREVARKLADAGANELLLSVDTFHQQTIPLEPVHAFAEEIQADGRMKIRLSPAWVVNRRHENAYNARTEEILAAFADLEIPVGGGNDIFMSGNAIRNLAQFYPAPQLNMADKCGSMPYTEPLTHQTSLSIEPNGDVTVCGFAIGNIYREHISEIIARYDPFADETMRAVMDGAPAMLEMAKKRGIEVDPAKCYSVCDICRALNAKKN